MHWFLKLWIVILIITFFLGFVLFISPKLLPENLISNSEKYGIIWSDERWSGEIRITGDILTVPGATITVTPGTKILIENSGDRSNMDLIPIHNRSGVNDSPETMGDIRHGEPFLDEGQKISLRIFKMLALGTKEQPIIINSAAINKSPYDIDTISIRNGILSNVYLSHYRKLAVGSVIIKHALFTEVGECSVCASKASPTISESVFDKSLRNYIFIVRGSPTIDHNLFFPIKGNGIEIDPQRVGSPKIFNNEFQIPGQSAISLLTGGEKNGGVISNNLFAAGDISIPCDSKVRIFDNHIKSNLNFIKSGNCNGEYHIGLNYWEINNPQNVVKERVIGTEPKFKVLIDGVLAQSPKNVGRAN